MARRRCSPSVSTHKSFGVDTRGATAVEFGMIAFPLFLLIMGIIEGGRMLWTQNALQYAAEQAARCAVVNTTVCGTASQIQSYAVSQAYGLHLSTSAFSSINTTCGAQVSASLPYKPLMPIPISVTLTSKSCRPH